MLEKMRILEKKKKKVQRCVRQPRSLRIEQKKKEKIMTICCTKHMLQCHFNCSECQTKRFLLGLSHLTF